MYIIINFARNRASIWLEPFTCGLLDFRQLKWSKTPELAFAELFIFFASPLREDLNYEMRATKEKRDPKPTIWQGQDENVTFSTLVSFFIFRWPNIIWESSKLSRGPLLFKCQIYLVSRFQPPSPGYQMNTPNCDTII